MTAHRPALDDHSGSPHDRLLALASRCAVALPALGFVDPACILRQDNVPTIALVGHHLDRPWGLGFSQPHLLRLHAMHLLCRHAEPFAITRARQRWIRHLLRSEGLLAVGLPPAEQETRFVAPPHSGHAQARALLWVRARLLQLGWDGNPLIHP